MSLKKFFCGALAASMIFSASMFCSAASEESATSKLAKIEIDTYGMEQSGALLDRISRLEKSYNGQNMNGNMNARIDAIYETLYENEYEPGILAKINALEWNIDHEVQSGGIDKRLVTLENSILGKVNGGTFNDRIRELAKASYGQEILPITKVSIPMNTLIKVATTIPVGSKTLQEGDTIPVKVVDDIFVDGSLVFARGLTGEGTVTSVRRAKNIFSNGKIEVDFNLLKAIDGQDAKIFTGIEAVDAMTADSMARGLSLLGQTFSGKNKEIEEVLVRGKNIDLPAGVELYVQIKTPIVVYGVSSTSDNNASRPSVETVNVPTPEEQPTQPTEQTQPTQTTIEPSNESELLPDEMTATPPPPAEEPAPEDDNILVQVDPEPTTPTKPAPTQVEPRPEEGKTPSGNGGEVIEIFDED